MRHTLMACTRKSGPYRGSRPRRRPVPPLSRLQACRRAAASMGIDEMTSGESGADPLKPRRLDRENVEQAAVAVVVEGHRGRDVLGGSSRSASTVMENIRFEARADRLDRVAPRNRCSRRECGLEARHKKPAPRSTCLPPSARRLRLRRCVVVTADRVERNRRSHELSAIDSKWFGRESGTRVP